MLYMGVDLGGTGIKAGVVSENGEILSKGSTPTMKERPYQDIIRDIAALCEKVAGQANVTMDEIAAIGVGVPMNDKTSTGKTFYVLDEPTTGLHIADCERLVRVLRQLARGGNSVLIIEHNLDVIKACDYVIDLGPEGGSGGGTLVCEGTPEDICQCEKSYTGQYLAPVLKKSRRIESED